jgi:hypothetical protein
MLEHLMDIKFCSQQIAQLLKIQKKYVYPTNPVWPVTIGQPAWTTSKDSWQARIPKCHETLFVFFALQNFSVQNLW